MKKNLQISTCFMMLCGLFICLSSCGLKIPGYVTEKKWKELDLRYDYAKFSRVSMCIGRWEKDSLEKEQTITVIEFRPWELHSIVYTPNFVIGVDEQGDTIAAIANQTSDTTFRAGDTMIIAPAYFSENDKLYASTVSREYNRDPKKDDIYCVVRKQYYAEFKRPPSKTK